MPTATSSPPLASRLTGWTPAEPLPPGVTGADLRQELARLDHSARPASPEEWAVLIGLLRRLASVFRIEVDDWALLTRLYADGLRDVPADLLRQAVQRVIGHWTNGFRMPLPGEIRAEVSAELAERVGAVARLRTAAMVAGRQDRKGRAETRAEADARMRRRAAAVERHQDRAGDGMPELTPDQMRARAQQWAAELGV